ncbi:ABC transporter permease [Streptantibioticus rubrisoli]|uniref:ABC transporter permease subunit n=1 Tax=Streptantibioticus rubrisoli TaxID=1387313 RepID=A0ABT1PL97_9ACTN|nr:ABC transporter permease subunit [Streptantibioticus rubrisoli]MCQ4045571.1 ABC transporter permease subunit [Streptantibioticus rubrisoli]
MARRRGLAKLVLLAVVAAVVVPLVNSRWGSGSWPAALTVDPSGSLGKASNWIIDNRDSSPVFLYFFGYVSYGVGYAVRGVYLVLLALGWTGVTAAATLLAWRFARLRVALTALVSLAACGALGMWVPTVQTLALMVVAVVASVAVGAVLGLAAGLSERMFRVLRPVLDTMQVLPAFAYLLPFVWIFGIGVPPAVLATVVYAAPPMARLTALGLRGADSGVLEAVTSLGATARQRLFTARLPLARGQLLLGVNQTIMMALSMAVIASVIGAGGLGDRVYQALSTVDVGNALAAGVPIVLLAVVLDRTTAAAGERVGAGGGAGVGSGGGASAGGSGGASGSGSGEGASGGASGSGSGGGASGRASGRASGGGGSAGGLRVWRVFGRGWVVWGALAGLVAGCAVLGRAFDSASWPGSWTVSIAAPVNSVVNWITGHLNSGVPVIGGTADWAAGFTTWVLDPVRDGLQGLPWWSVLLVVGALAWLIGTWRTALTAVLAMAAIGVLGVWSVSLDTLSQVLAALAVTLVVGVGVGIAAARSRRFEALLRPVLDVFQTMPQFVYLIPVVALFGAGRAAGAAAAVAYAVPAVVRITTQGLREVDPAAMEAARSLGATGGQQVRQVQLPLARPALLLAVNQAVVLVLAVVVIAGMIGGGALGYNVVFGLAQGDLATGLIGGTAIVCLGLMLDRVTQPVGKGR